MNEQLKELEEKISYHFQDKHLLAQALTHSSYANEHRLDHNHCNERLEFLGDAVLEIVTSDFLYHKYTEKPEGSDKDQSQHCLRADPGVLCRSYQPWKLSVFRQRRRRNRRKKQKFCCIRCYGSSDRSYLSGRWFC